jgi:hypothetical protein
MGKLSRTFSLMSSSWEILKKDKEMIIFPILSCVACLIVMASFAYPLYSGGTWRVPAGSAPLAEQIRFWGPLFLFYFCNYFVIVFFNSGIVACATIRIRGGDPVVMDGLRAASSRLGLIAGWAILLSTVGIILRIIEQRFRRFGRIAAGLLGVSWSIASFLVVPILVVEGKGPITALKESASLLKKTWGEQVIGNFSFGLIFFLLSIPALLLIGIAFYSGFSLWMIFLIILAAEYLVFLALVQSTLQAVFQAAVYEYARSGVPPAGFQPEDIRGALGSKA